MKKFLLSIILTILLIASPTSAEFFPDIIVTSPHGIWTDSRAYVDLNAAITAVGTDERTIKIVSPQTVIALTVPSNVTLSFERNGSITNSGQLTINSRNIIAKDRQIFTGVGDIDFAVGSVVRSSWFSDVAEAIDVTNDDELTLIISKPSFVTSSCAVGNNVNLKWESARNRLTANGGTTLSNIKNIEAGNFQLFAGAGDFDFLDGTRLNLSWFNSLRSVLTWIESEEVTVVVSGTNIVSHTDTAPSNIYFDLFSKNGQLSINGGVTLTINGTVFIDDLGSFIGAGAVDHSGASFIMPSTPSIENAEYVSKYDYDFDAAVTAIGATETTLYVDADCAMSADVVTPSTLSIIALNGCLIDLNGNNLTISGPFEAGTYQVFTGAGNVSFTIPCIVWADWWGGKTAASLQLCFSAVSEGSTIKLSGGTWNFGATNVNLVNKDIHLEGVGYTDAAAGTNISFTGTGAAIMLNGFCTISKLRMSGAGEYGLQLGNSTGVGGLAWVGRAYDLFITGKTKAGIHAYAIQLGFCENVYSQHNTGAGMLVLGGSNTHGIFIKCGFRLNDEEGILYNTNAAFRYYGCILESNGYEAVKNEVATLTSTLIEGCWFENNQNDALRVDGYYQLLFSNVANASIGLVRNYFNTPSDPWNGAAGNKHVGFKGSLIIEDNYWVGTSPPYVEYKQINASLTNKGINLHIGLVGFSDDQNVYNNGRGTQDILTMPSSGWVGRWSNVTVVNTTAIGAVEYDLPPAQEGNRITFVVGAAHQLDIDPDAADQILPTTNAVGDRLRNAGNLGESVTLIGLSSDYWVIAAEKGTWIDAN